MKFCATGALRALRVEAAMRLMELKTAGGPRISQETAIHKCQVC